MSKVIPMFPPEPALAERLAARRAYRKRCRDVASVFVAKAFSASAEGIPIGVEEALPLFVAAMRREMRKVHPC